MVSSTIGPWLSWETLLIRCLKLSASCEKCARVGRILMFLWYLTVQESIYWAWTRKVRRWLFHRHWPHRRRVWKWWSLVSTVRNQSSQLFILKVAFSHSLLFPTVIVVRNSLRSMAEFWFYQKLSSLRFRKHPPLASKIKLFILMLVRPGMLKVILYVDQMDHFMSFS